MNNTTQPIGYAIIGGHTWQGFNLYLAKSGVEFTRNLSEAKIYKTIQGAIKAYPSLEVETIWRDPAKYGNKATYRLAI